MYINSSIIASDLSLGSKKEKKSDLSENESQNIWKNMTNDMNHHKNASSSRELSSQKRNQRKSVKIKYISSIDEVSVMLLKEMNNYKKIIEGLIKSVQTLKEEKIELNSLNRKLYEIMQFKEKSSSMMNSNVDTKYSLFEINKKYISSQFDILFDERDDILEEGIEKIKKSEKGSKVPILNIEKAQKINENLIKAEQENDRWLKSDIFSLMDIIKKQEENILNLSKSLEKEILENKKLRIEIKMLKNKKLKDFSLDQTLQKKIKSHFSETIIRSAGYKDFQEDDLLSKNKELTSNLKPSEHEKENESDMECSSGLFEIKNKFRNDFSYIKPKFISPVSKIFIDDHHLTEAEDIKANFINFKDMFD